MHVRQFYEWINGFLHYADLGIDHVEFSPKEEKIRQRVSRPNKDGVSSAFVEEKTVQRQVPYFVHSGVGRFQGKLTLDEESHGTRPPFFTS
jgi:hypothetical protein